MARRGDQRPTSLHLLEYDDEDLKSIYGDIFTPDDDTLSATTIQQSIQHATNQYQSLTLNNNNMARRLLLPILPSSCMLKANAQNASTIPAQHSAPELLLSNVPIGLLTWQQYQQRQAGTFIDPFTISHWDFISRHNIDSFMVTLHKNLYTQLQQQWHIDKAIIDCNLHRLNNLLRQHNFSLTVDELPLALEFFLQMDVDLFHLKTCSFRGAQPIQWQTNNGHIQSEGIFSTSVSSRQARYGMKACGQINCFCCHSPSTRRQPPKLMTGAIQFADQQMHQFVHRYTAILNCPVDCNTANIIYALTCPCGQYDYVAHTNQSFADCLAYHCREGNRIMREFLIGERNVMNTMDNVPKTEEEKANDQQWLYQHSCRCPKAVQHFLDHNPKYWCFVPFQIDTTTTATTTIVASSAMLWTGGEDGQQRSDLTAVHYANCVMAPPYGYSYNRQLWEEQKSFFKYGKDQDQSTSNDVYLYKATIVAVLPNDCSESMKKFIESLFITHGECQLNMQGRLIGQNFFLSYSTRGRWCEGLIRRP